MKNQVVSLLDQAEEGVKQEFLEHTSSSLEVKTDYERVEFDYSWLEKIEATIEDLDTIVRNPRRFIAQEEEIVPIEKSKKITQESIRHLAQHTDLIQDFDEKKGTITPSKILNINKEESYDIYENRFIYSLLLNLQMFIAKRKELTESGSRMNSAKEFQYRGESKIGAERVKVSLHLQSAAQEDLVGKNNAGMDLRERLDRIQMIISDFMKSAFIRELAGAHAMVVKSPIRKTNVILKNQNFQKALELWEFIEQYDVKDKKEVRESNAYRDEGKLRDYVDETFLMNYLVMDTLSLDHKKSNIHTKKYYVHQIIEDFVEHNHDVGERQFQRLLLQEFKLAKDNQRKREKNIQKRVERAIMEFHTHTQKSILFLKEIK